MSARLVSQTVGAALVAICNRRPRTPRRLSPGDRQNVEVLIEAEVVLAALAFHVLGLQNARRFRFFLVFSAFATPGRERLFDLCNLCIGQLRIGEGAGTEQNRFAGECDEIVWNNV